MFRKTSRRRGSGSANALRAAGTGSEEFELGARPHNCAGHAFAIAGKVIAQDVVVALRQDAIGKSRQFAATQHFSFRGEADISNSRLQNWIYAYAA